MAKKKAISKKKSSQILPESYEEMLYALKEIIKNAQVRASIKVNEELIKLYLEIGKTIVDKQKEEGWGSRVIDRMSVDLKGSFPRMTGLSPRNLLYMKQFAEAYPALEISQQPVAKLPWGHNVVLINKLQSMEERIWYAQKAIENGWSRSILEMWIESDLFSRQGKAITNFKKTMPKPESDLANQTLKDPYCFEFLSMSEEAEERDIEEGLLNHIQNFLTELGVGFAFIGRQYRLEVDGDEFFIDLLFYHYKLRRFIVIELKNTSFKPEYAGKMSFYLAAVDATLKHPDDEASIGMILCKTKKKLIVEYALQDKKRPMGVATYKTNLVESLPQNLMPSLPTVEQIEAEFSKDLKKKKKG